MTLDFHKLAKRWQREWKKRNLFDAEPNDRPKFFVTTPYPYVNGLLHLGHTYTYMRVEALARFKRMQGYNVLFPFAFHATGSPIDTAARRVAEGETKQIDILKSMGFDDVAPFKDPIHWITTFSKEAEKDLRAYGLSIDWRRTFITTDLNKRYDKFIKWQFKELKKKGLVAKGNHPVVWCPKENQPVGDHSRSEGEGETPQEFLLFKHKLGDKYIVSATLRPDTVLGITNLFVNANTTYKEITINGEHWIVGKSAAQGLQEQGHDVTVVADIAGTTLIGKHVETFGGRRVLILPATFLSETVGTGLVHSVPSDSADDLIALFDLQKNDALMNKYGLDVEEVKNIRPIAVLNTPEYGDNPAETLLKKYNITSQHQRDKLEEIRKELYKLSHYTATFNEKYRNAFSENLEGKKVEHGKDIIKKDLIAKKFAQAYYQLTGKVVCRCLTECIVKIVDNQWFLKYSDAEWKRKTHTCISEMKLYPDKMRSQFEHVIDWLNDWACTREIGLGTSLPWDKHWKIESLSDSTIYTAFYTLMPRLKKIPLAQINDKLFSYVLLGEGDVSQIKIAPEIINAMRNEFTYWYPVDVRNSGKDLIQNHFAFYLFNHTAIFPQEYWPRGIAANGYVTVGKAKMSKSKGNFKTLRQLISAFGADIVRISVLSSGEELNDTDWDDEFAASITSKLEQWYTFAVKSHPSKDGHAKNEIDKWMEHKIHTAIKETTLAMEQMQYRTALTKGFFDLQRFFKWYQRRSAGKMNNHVLKDLIEVQTLMLAPFTAHLCEEIWKKIGKEQLIANERWPLADEQKINPLLEHNEQLMEQTLNDINHVLRLAKVEKPRTITFIVANSWKTELVRKLKDVLGQTRDVGTIMKTMLSEFKQPEAPQLIQKLIKDPSKMPETVIAQDAEYQQLLDSRAFINQEYNCAVHVFKEQDSPHEKAQQALPGKPALVVE